MAFWELARREGGPDFGEPPNPNLSRREAGAGEGFKTPNPKGLLELLLRRIRLDIPCLFGE